MSRWLNAGLAILLVFGMLPVVSVQAQTNPCIFSGVDENGAYYYISLPFNPYQGQCVYDADLVVFAHGYVAVNKPLEIPWDQMTFKNPADPTTFLYLPDIVNGMGFAFATTSYRVNGLAVQEGVEDIINLVGMYGNIGAPSRVYLVGASEGGLVTTLALERRPDVFSGGMAMCGPIGSFTKQVNYWGDFRVVFDYFMDTPDFDVLPGNASNIPASLMKKWDLVYFPRITGVLGANPLSIPHLFVVTGAPIYSEPATFGPTTLGILWYNVFATNDAIDKLGGRPFDNFDRVYSDPLNPTLDALINAGVKRFKAQPAALEEIANKYETTGNLMRPMVTIHTTGDPIVPVWHQGLYTGKVPGVFPYFPYVPITVDRYGHCNFTLDEIQGAFGQLVGMVMYGAVSSAMPMRTLDAGESLQQVDGIYYYDYH